MTQSKRRSGLKARIALSGALAAGAIMAFSVSSAQAAPSPFHATFDDAALNVGATFDILDPPNTAPVNGTFESVGNTLTIPAANFVLPTFSGDPITGLHVDVDFAATAGPDITGTLTNPGGALNLASHSYTAIVKVNGGANCTYTAPMIFSTTSPSGGPFNGQAFTVGAPDVTVTHGAIETHWASLPADNSSPDCNLVNGLVSGPGGLAIGNGVDLTPPAPSGGGTTTPPATTAPAKKKCKKAKKKSASSSKKSKCKKKKKK